MNIKELFFDVPTGRIAALRAGTGPLVLALHGWLDNAGSFVPVMKHLPQYDIIAIDFPGHGLSHHKPPSQVLHAYDLILDVLYVLEALEGPVYLLGHSLGAAIGLFVAALGHPSLQKLWCIDCLGPLTMHPEQAPLRMKQAFEGYLRLGLKTLPLYPSIEAAQKRRAEHTHMDANVLTPLIQRGLQSIEGGYTWRTDPRLMIAEPIRFTEAQVLAFLRQITLPVELLLANQGYDFGASIMAERMAAVPSLQVVHMEGGHHVHMEHPQAVAAWFHESASNITTYTHQT